jgi:hypothetical protein
MRSIPLHEFIESKFGQFLTIYRSNEERFYLYKILEPNEDGTARNLPEPFIIYDDTDKQYRFEGRKLFTQDFIKVLNLLAFM